MLGLRANGVVCEPGRVGASAALPESAHSPRVLGPLLIDSQQVTGERPGLAVWPPRASTFWRVSPCLLQKRAQKKVEETLTIRVELRVVPPKELERSQGKAVRVVDRRED